MKALIFLITLTTFAVILSVARATGEWEPIKNTNDEHIRELAEFAVESYNTHGWGRQLKLESVVRAKSQVVAGMKYQLLLRVTTIGDEDTATYLYETVVRRNPSNVKELVYFKPISASSSFDRIGGWRRIKNVNDEHVKEIAKFAVENNNLQNWDQYLKLVSVLGGKIQVVDGINYKLFLKVTLANVTSTTVHVYETIVYENLSNVKKVISFKQLDVSEATLKH